MKKFLKWFLSPKSDIVLFMIVLLLCCVAGNRFYKRFDMTASKAFSLSEASIQTVSNLYEPLTVHVFFSDDLTSPYNTTYQYIKDLLAEYEREGNENFNVVYYDMDKDENQSEAQKYGISQVPIQDVSETKVDMKLAWMGLVLTYGDSIVPLNGITSPYGFEYNLTTKMIKMVSAQDNLAGLSSGETIKITFYGAEKFNRVIPGYNQLDGFVKSAVNELNRKNQNCLEYSYVLPKEDEKSLLVEKYGIQEIGFSDGSSEVFGLVAEYGTRFRHIFLKIDTSKGFPIISGADSISASIEEALLGFVSNNLQVGYLKGHGEPSLSDEEGKSLNIVRNMADIYEFKEIDLKESEIPSNISLLFINGPKNTFSEAELYKIDQFLMQGGNILFLADSYELGGNQYQPQAVKLNTGLIEQFEKYGIKINKDRLYDSGCYEARDRYGRQTKLYEAPVISKDNMNQKNVISKNLGFVILLNASTLDVSGAREKGLDVSVLARSSSKAWTLSDNLQFSPSVYEPGESDMSSFDLAVLVGGKFNSAFDGPVNAAESKEMSADDHIEKAVQYGNIFVVGTSQIAADNMFDVSCNEPVAMFLRNAIDYLNGNGSLCEMRTKGADFSTLNIDEERDVKKISTVKYACQIGAPLAIALTGLLMLWVRISKKRKIHLMYNPDDKREFIGEGAKKAEEVAGAKDGE